MRFTIAKKINFSAILLVFLSFCLGGYSIYSSVIGSEISLNIEKIFLPVSSHINDLALNITTTTEDVSEYIMEPSTEKEKEISTKFDQVRQNLDGLSNLVKAGDNIKKLPIVSEMLPGMIAANDNFVKNARDTMKISVTTFSMGANFNEKLTKYEDDINDFYYITLNEAIRQMNNNNMAFVNQLFGNLDLIKSVSNNLFLLGELESYAMNNNSNRDLAKINELFKSAEASMSAIASVVKSEANLKKVKQYSSQFAELKTISTNLHSVIVDFEKKAEDLVVAVADLTKSLNMLSDRIKMVLNGQIVLASAGQASGLFVSVVLLAILGVFGLIVMIFLNRSVTAQISMFVTTVGELTSGDGDLTKRIKAKNNDELHDLAINFNKFIENVQYIIVEVKNSSEEVASGNNQLAATMEELSSTFDSQSRQIAEMVESIEGVERTATEAFNDLSENIKVLETTTDLTNKGANELADIKTSVEEISRQTNELSSTISKLTESSTHIGDILSVINDIADQTNLLALNAAIEAARAGDAGRGFAVVADEVRKLAERTQKATGEIDIIVGSLQKESDNASTVMKKASETVLSGVSKIVHTAEGFTEVVNGVTDVNANVQIVTSAVASQNNMIKNVVDNSQAIASGIEESNAAVNEVNSTVAHLQKRTDNLKALVGRFKVQ